MRQQLFDNNFMILDEFIPRDDALKLAEIFKADCERADLPGDQQAPNSYSIYNYKQALELLCNSTNRVSEIVDEPVLPTYTYARVYKEGSVLEKHKDRPSCEVSLTLHLNGDKPWPIWIKNKEGKNVCVELNPGDALFILVVLLLTGEMSFTVHGMLKCLCIMLDLTVLLLGFTLIKKKMRSMNLKS